MAALAQSNMTLLDMVKATGVDGSIENTIEILDQTNEVIDDMVWRNGNLTTGHQHSVRTGIPSPVWGQLYKGVSPTKAERAQVTDTCGFLEDMSETDVRLLKLSSDPMALRAIEDRPHVEGMGQEFVNTLFKGTADEAEKFIGLEERFSDMSAANGENIIDTSIDEDTDVHSVWLIGWSDRTCFGIVPKNSQAGLQQSDEGEDWITDSAGGRFKIVRTYWKWDVGLAVPDWRYVVRAQVDMSELTNTGETGVNLPYLFHDMLERLPGDAFSSTRLAFYTNRKIITKARKQLASGIDNSTLALRQVGAVGDGLTPKRKFFFDDIPMNRVDALAVDEVLVS